MGNPVVTELPRAFYAHRGSTSADLITLLHVPYTVWHLSYVAIGAALAPQLDSMRLVGTLLAFLAGLGVGAHAFDELHDRPLATSLSDRQLVTIGAVAMVLAGAIAAAGAVVISPWVLAWAAGGIILACGYSLEWSALIHTDLGFALAWGAFPVLVGYWAQAETLAAPAILGAVGATGLSLIQRLLSRSAKQIRRGPPVDLGVAERQSRLDAAERPLRLLSAAMPLAAVVMLFL